MSVATHGSRTKQTARFVRDYAQLFFTLTGQCNMIAPYLFAAKIYPYDFQISRKDRRENNMVQ
jgi:hypothetical protein